MIFEQQYKAVMSPLTSLSTIAWSIADRPASLECMTAGFRPFAPVIVKLEIECSNFVKRSFREMVLS